METIGLETLFEEHAEADTVEVLIGLKDESYTSKIETYCGDDGTILKQPGFGICRIEVTISCLQDLVHGADAWVDYIEPAAQNAEKWETEYEKEYTQND